MPRGPLIIGSGTQIPCTYVHNKKLAFQSNYSCALQASANSIDDIKSMGLFNQGHIYYAHQEMLQDSQISFIDVLE